MLVARVAFGALLLVSLVSGFLALYARDVRRDRDATRRFAGVGAAATLLTVAVGWWAL